MKTKLLLSALLAFVFYLSSAQVPQGINYQAIARDVSGYPIVSQTLQVELSIQSDTSSNPAVVWKERFNPVKTNSFGLFTVVLGTGVRQTGSSALTFSDVNWAVPQLFIRTQIYYQNIWKPMGQAKLWSVPYAMVSGNLSGPVKKLAITSLNVSPDSAIFEVKNNTGQTVFAVYNEGVRVYVDNGVKGNRGGFAIGGFGTAKAPSQSLLMISPDSARVYVGASKGGFAVNGFGTGTNPKQNLMLISPDSARIYVKESVAKGTRGGFAIGGFNPAKGTVKEFMIMTPKNYFIGHNSGQLISSSGIYNSTLGYESGKSLVNGSSNVFIGYQSGLTTNNGGSNVFIGTQAGYYNKVGHYNIMLGRQAGFNNRANSNIFIGDQAGLADTSGFQNVFIGDWAGYTNLTGNQNVFLGAEAGFYNKSGNYNNFMGYRAGYQNIGGSFNSFLGYQSGYNNTTGQFNTYLGYLAGYSGLSASGSNNIFMGVEAGFSNTFGHDNIAIGNKAGRNILDGIYNVMIGSDAGISNASGNYNTMVGYKAGEKHVGNYGTFLGYLAGNLTTSGNSQTMVGYEAGSNNIGSYNTFVGVLAGGNSGYGEDNTYVGLAAGDNATGNRNVFLGKWAGYAEPESDKLIISNNYIGIDNYNNALIYGDFASKYLHINGDISAVDILATNDNPAISGYHNVTAWYGVGVQGIGGFKGVEGLSTFVGGGSRFGVIGTASGGTYNYGVYGSATGGTAYAGYFAGNLTYTGSLIPPSDIRLKKNILPLSGSLQKVLGLQGVTYEWKSETELASSNVRKGGDRKESEPQSFNFPTGVQLGVIAQDVEKILPELVQTDADGLKSVDYIKMIPLLIEAIKDQQRQIEELKALIKSTSGPQKK